MSCSCLHGTKRGWRFPLQSRSRSYPPGAPIPLWTHWHLNPWSYQFLSWQLIFGVARNDYWNNPKRASPPRSTQDERGPRQNTSKDKPEGVISNIKFAYTLQPEGVISNIKLAYTVSMYQISNHIFVASE